MDLNLIFEYALPYSRYRQLVDKLLLEGKTTGSNQSEKLTEFTKLNVQRMGRIDKTILLSPDSKTYYESMTRSYKWLLIGDAWCGDCAQIIPIINKIAEAAVANIDFRIISRDIFPELIENFKTGESKSIPKLIVFDPISAHVCATWGPRPEEAQSIMLNWKERRGSISWEDFEKDLHTWYAKNKGVATIQELTSIIRTCEKNTLSLL